MSSSQWAWLVGSLLCLFRSPGVWNRRAVQPPCLLQKGCADLEQLVGLPVPDVTNVLGRHGSLANPRTVSLRWALMIVSTCFGKPVMVVSARHWLAIGQPFTLIFGDAPH